MRYVLAIAGVLCGSGGAQAIDHPCVEGVAKTGSVQKISPRGHWFTLKGSPQKYTLAGVILNHPSNLGGALADELTVFPTANSADRYGRVAVQVWQDGTWVQGKILSNGEAYAFPVEVSSLCRRALFETEKQAEVQSRGLWAASTIAMKAEDLRSLSSKFGHFALVQGKVLSVGNRKRRIYLNFGQKWSQDFTVSVLKKGSGAYNGDINALLNLKNKTIRVRGMLEKQQGPLIRVFHEGQIEFAD